MEPSQSSVTFRDPPLNESATRTTPVAIVAPPAASAAPPPAATRKSPARKPAETSVGQHQIAAAPALPAPEKPASASRSTTPNLAILERNAKPAVADAAAAQAGKKQKKPVLGPRSGYRYPANKACDVITDLTDPENVERLQLMSRLERYSEAFPQVGIAPADAFDLDLPDLRAHLRNLEQRLAGEGASTFSMIGMVTSMVGAALEKFFPSKLAGLCGVWEHSLKKNEQKVRLLEAKYGSPSIPIEVTFVVGCLAMPAFAVWSMNSEKEENQDPQTEGETSGTSV